VQGISNATAITTGYASTCALLSGGTVDCWGDNLYGELGDPNITTSYSNTPVPADISNATAITTGGQYTCALLSGGAVDCWGYNGQGELGEGNTTDNSTPEPVKSPW
jgi:alpha-tubulin suppressor-like RCC1 family protein